MQHTAFALRAEYEGTVEVELADGSTEQRPVFGGGVLVAGDGDFHLRDELDRGNGIIVVPVRDAPLIEVLDRIPALKHVKVPESPVAIISPYERRTHEVNRHEASLRDIEGAGKLSAKALVKALEAYDAAQLAGQPEQVQAVQEAPETAAPPEGAGEQDGPPEPEPSDVDALDTAQLIAVLDNDTAFFADVGKVNVPAALEELRRRAPHDDGAAQALADHGIDPAKEA